MTKTSLRRKSNKSNKRTNSKKLKGGFIRSGTPQFSYYCGKNPVYYNANTEFLNVCNESCNNNNLMSGGKSRKKKSNRNKKSRKN